MPEVMQIPTTIMTRLRDKVKVESGIKQRTWGGWVRRDIVKCGEVEIGHIQVRRRNKRTESLTGNTELACVLGTDVAWLIREALAKGLISHMVNPQ